MSQLDVRRCAIKSLTWASERSEQNGAGDEEEQAGTEAVKHAQRAGGKETATPQEGAEAEGSPQLKFESALLL